ncbi:enoyl-CoA hydratase [Bradyrhizobium sp. SSBR45G]|uniref:crotonase/enoyl-CoA hydratase family protein n=1 Tax=unclassified Bradyrhizobium TaxID=2631580 RepID=UPI002342957A|nr:MULTISPECIES: crotonase/enoyl-CoA hydratase family protein [unclassified Bradyrhizobium]GLH81137.1 enoyl-CoA hydratase [Bradyrhizobium sp. SSBR45G]GLH88490.1 enoyl-CoA hydratase [Bradyrhizobium sp. SSBR45R]
MADPILLHVSDRIALLTLNRPEQLNALSYALIDALMAALDRIETDDGIRAVILTGAGDRAFSAGADIDEFSESVHEGRATALRDFVRRGQAMTARLEAFRKPVIAAVNGLAFGGGCEITEAVHLAVASARASFAKPEIRLGMPPTFGGTQRLPRLVGRKRGLELLLTGDPFPAERALQIGLVNAVVPHDELLPAAQALAQRIIRHGPDAVAAVITAATRGLNMAISEGLQVEREQFASLIGGRDLEQGLAAWRERRSPRVSS